MDCPQCKQPLEVVIHDRTTGDVLDVATAANNPIDNRWVVFLCRSCWSIGEYMAGLPLLREATTPIRSAHSCSDPHVIPAVSYTGTSDFITPIPLELVPADVDVDSTPLHRVEWCLGCRKIRDRYGVEHLVWEGGFVDKEGNIAPYLYLTA